MYTIIDVFVRHYLPVSSLELEALKSSRDVGTKFYFVSVGRGHAGVHLDQQRARLGQLQLAVALLVDNHIVLLVLDARCTRNIRIIPALRAIRLP